MHRPTPPLQFVQRAGVVLFRAVAALLLCAQPACSDPAPAARPSLEVGRQAQTATSAGTAAPDDQGARIYDRTCSLCHGADGRGSAAARGASFLGDSSPLSKSDGVLSKSIKEGLQGSTGVMPPFGQALSDAQIQQVLAYVRRRFGS